MSSYTFAVGLLPIVGFAMACSADADTAAAAFPSAVMTDGGHFHLELEHNPWPAVAGDASLHITIMDAEADMMMVDGATLTLEPWMPGHDHGTAEPPEIMEHGEGVYLASWAYSMPGSWQLNLAITSTDGQTDTAQIDVEVQ